MVHASLRSRWKPRSTTADAVALAVDRGWCEVAGGRIVCLTDEGRAIVSGVGSDDD
jgi:hypothetical protein